MEEIHREEQSEKLDPFVSREREGTGRAAARGISSCGEILLSFPQMDSKTLLCDFKHTLT